MTDAPHSMEQACDFCGGRHCGQSDTSLEDARRDLHRQMTRCRRSRTGMTTAHYPPVVNHNDNFITIDRR